MKSRFLWVFLIVLGMALGYGLSHSEKTAVAQNKTFDPEDVLKQIESIQTDVKAINELLQSGKLQVVVAIYPPDSDNQ